MGLPTRSEMGHTLPSVSRVQLPTCGFAHGCLVLARLCLRASAENRSPGLSAGLGCRDMLCPQAVGIFQCQRTMHVATRESTGPCPTSQTLSGSSRSALSLLVAVAINPFCS